MAIHHMRNCHKNKYLAQFLTLSSAMKSNFNEFVGIDPDWSIFFEIININKFIVNIDNNKY